MSLHFVSHAQIDFARWDEAIQTCYNENPYAYSGWLNMVCPQWCALVNSDYSILMPLPVKVKLGIPYISQPPFTQQLGIFASQAVDSTFIEKALESIPKKYLKVYLQLNTDNAPFEHSHERPTYGISLNRPYEALYNEFNAHHKRNVSKAVALNQAGQINIIASTDGSLFINLFKQTVGQKDSTLKRRDYLIMEKLLASGQGQILFCTGSSGEVLAGLFYLMSRTKTVNLFNFNTAGGRSSKAMYLLVNHWIKCTSSQNLWLDFEGSEIPSIARFYLGFGGLEKKYQTFTKKIFS